jgi:monofunctional biosynthetic peptidoglycan transglycosylase
MVRKAFEVVFVYLIEALWGKQRILEVYVNMIEWGDGIYGVQQAARQHFGTTAAQIRPDQAGLLAAVLPNPRKFNAGKPSPYIKRKASGFRGRVGGGVRSK